jgi:hypothetical protein
MYKPDAVQSMRRAVEQNYLGSLGRPGQFRRTEAELSPESAETMKQLIARAEKAAAAGYAGGAGDRTMKPGVTSQPGDQLQFLVQCGGANYEAVSNGPMPQPWRVKSLTVSGVVVNYQSGMAITATLGDCTGVTTPQYGSLIISPAYSPGLGMPEGYFLPTQVAVPITIDNPGVVQDAGTYLTVWVFNSTGLGPNAFSATAAIEYQIGSDVTTSLEIAKIATRTGRTAPLPAPRSDANATPTGAIISGPGFSRRIPWADLAPGLQKEWRVNQFNGKSTPGLTEIW